MRKYIFPVAVLFVLANYALALAIPIGLPVDPVRMFLDFSRDNPPKSRFEITFFGLPEGLSVKNEIVYSGWCANRNIEIKKGTYHITRLYSSLDEPENIPTDLRNIPWQKVNFMINHKIGDVMDIQLAIWHVIHGHGELTPKAQELIWNMERNISSFNIESSMVFAVVCFVSNDQQPVFIELPLTEKKGPASFLYWPVSAPLFHHVPVPDIFTLGTPGVPVPSYVGASAGSLAGLSGLFSDDNEESYTRTSPSNQPYPTPPLPPNPFPPGPPPPNNPPVGPQPPEPPSPPEPPNPPGPPNPPPPPPTPVPEPPVVVLLAVALTVLGIIKQKKW